MREGYQGDFLGGDFAVELPRPCLALESDVLKPPGMEDGVVPYIHYSLMMSRSTRQALFSAANVDLEKGRTVPSGKGRRWFVDGRVGRDNQITNYAYQGTQWDRGHLTRRTAVTWGDTVAFATDASNDSCAYTNASMQHEHFNEDEWRAVETLVSKFELATKLSVFTGPVFTTADRYFTRESGDFPVRIPSAFWKLVVYVDPRNRLTTQAYIFFQDIPTVTSTNARAGVQLQNQQVTTTEVEMWTGLTFDQKLYDSNPLQFYSGPERISTRAHRDLLNRDRATLTLDEGIVGEESIAAARSALPLEDFYALIDEICWV